MTGKFPEDREHGRLFIDFFAQIYNEEDYETIQKLLESDFDETVMALKDINKEIFIPQ